LKQVGHYSALVCQIFAVIAFFVVTGSDDSIGIKVVLVIANVIPFLVLFFTDRYRKALRIVFLAISILWFLFFTKILDPVFISDKLVYYRVIYYRVINFGSLASRVIIYGSLASCILAFIFPYKTGFGKFVLVTAACLILGTGGNKITAKLHGVWQTMAKGVETTTAATTGITATVNTSVNFRMGPSTDTEVIKQLSKGVILTIIGETSSGWVPVEYEGTKGWVSAEFISINN
jgi:hypothetical protein